MEIKFNPITIAMAERDKESTSVWVVNTSGSKETGKGIINITIVEGNGRAAVVRIPVTNIPIDLTTQATKSALLMSPDFRRLVAAHIFILISEEEAMAALDNDQARAEQRRLMNIDQVHEVQEASYTPQVKSLIAESKGNIGGLAMNIAHQTDGDEENILASLRNNIDTLDQAELQYIVNNSTFHKVKALAAEHIVR